MENTVKNLMFDLAVGREIFDEEQARAISKVEANEKIRQICFEKLGLNEKSTARDINRALKRDAANELFQVIEEIADRMVSTGWTQNEFFNRFVETKNMADGDRNEFYTEQDIILTVAKTAGSHHDITVQKLGYGESYSIPTSYYAVKVGSDIRLFLTGRKDWADFLAHAAAAFVNEIQNEMYTETMKVSSQIPTQFQKTGTLGTTTKATFDQLIEDVSTANDGAPVVIMGVKTALKKINDLADVDWISMSMKEAVANSGILGTYEGTELLEIPQRFEKNDTATKLVATNKLLIMPQVDNRFVKFVDYGETELIVNEVGDTMDDFQTYELQRRMGVGTVTTRYYGVWTL